MQNKPNLAPSNASISSEYGYNTNFYLRSSSTDCSFNAGSLKLNDYLLNEAEVLNDLNTIIDSHSKYFNKKTQQEANIKNANENFNKKKSTQANLVKASSSYLTEKVNSEVTGKQKNIDSVCSTGSVTLISAKISPSSASDLNTAKDTLKSKSYLLSISRKSSDSNFNKALLNNTPKKTHTNDNATISGTKTKKLSGITLLPNNLTPATCFLNGARKKRSSLFNLFSFKNHSSMSSQSSSSSTNLSKNFSEKEIASSLKIGNDYEYDNVFFDSNSDLSNARETEILVSESCSTPNDYSSKTELRKDSYSTQSENSNSHTESKVISENSNPQSQLSKKLSIKSKGFSIPLNASFILNPVPINNLHNFTINNQSSNTDSEKDDKISLNKKRHSIKSMASPSLVQYLDPDHSSSFTNEHHKSQHNDDDDVIFKPKKYNLDEGSCLKELNQRFSAKFGDLKKSNESLNRELTSPQNESIAQIKVSNKNQIDSLSEAKCDKHGLKLMLHRDQVKLLTLKYLKNFYL